MRESTPDPKSTTQWDAIFGLPDEAGDQREAAQIIS
jgi:hypothetical protein